MNKLELALEMIQSMNIKQKDVANYIGVSTANLSRMLSGKVSIEKHFPGISAMFECWRKEELEKISVEIDKLNKMSKKAKRCLNT